VHWIWKIAFRQSKLKEERKERARSNKCAQGLSSHELLFFSEGKEQSLWRQSEGYVFNGAALADRRRSYLNLQARVGSAERKNPTGWVSPQQEKLLPLDMVTPSSVILQVHFPPSFPLLFIHRHFLRSSCGLWRIQPGERIISPSHANLMRVQFASAFRWSSRMNCSPSIGRTKNGRCCKTEPMMEIKKKELAFLLAVIFILPSSSLLLIGKPWPLLHSIQSKSPSSPFPLITPPLFPPLINIAFATRFYLFKFNSCRAILTLDSEKELMFVFGGKSNGYHNDIWKFDLGKYATYFPSYRIRHF